MHTVDKMKKKEISSEKIIARYTQIDIESVHYRHETITPQIRNHHITS